MYDDLGRVVETRFADETVTKTEYDSLGRRTAAIDALGRRTEFEYDDLGRLTDVVQFLDGREIRTEYGYDELGRQLFQEDANDNRTSFTYDRLGRRTSVTLPGDQVSTSTYDPNGNLRTYTDFNGEVMSYTYDEQNRLTFLDLEDDPDVTYTYTLNGLQDTITDRRGVTEFTYDSRNRLVGQKDPFGPYTTDNFSLQYQYDEAGNRTQVTTPGGITTYTFDERNRIETVTDSAQGNTTYTYDGESNLTQTTLPNGIVETRTYDKLNRLTRIEQKDGETVISSYTYDLNEVGNRASVTEADGRQVNYQYDDLDRLTQETITDPGNINDGRTYTYQYDDVGNRTVRIDSVEGTITYTYDENDRLLQETTNGISTTYTYDANGNTRTQTVDGQTPTTYTWDDRNRLVTVNTSDGDTVSYEYDDNNIRVSSTVGSLKTTYVVDSNRPYHQVLEEYEDGNIKARYVHGLDLISIEQDGDTSIYLVDGLGSTRTLTDASTGDVVASYDYDAYGELINSTGTTDNDYLFAGEQFDDNLDQYYLRQRFYNPSSGRFTRRDTYEGNERRPITLHKYLYSGTDPVNHIDPSGLSFFSAKLTVIQVSGILAGTVGLIGGGFYWSKYGDDHFVGLDESQDFSTADEAAIAALNRVHRQSYSGPEYGGAICKRGSKFYYTRPVIGDSNSVRAVYCPFGNSIHYGYYHTHGEPTYQLNGNGVQGFEFGEVPSDADIELTNEYSGKVGYLATPRGAIKKFTSDFKSNLDFNDPEYDSKDEEGITRGIIGFIEGTPYTSKDREGIYERYN